MQKQPFGATLHKTVVVVVLVMTVALSYESIAAVLTVSSDVETEGSINSIVSGSLEEFPKNGYRMSGSSLNVLSRDGNSWLSREMSLGNGGVDHVIAFSQDGGDSVYSDETGSDSVGSSSDDANLCPSGLQPGSKDTKAESSRITAGTDAFFSSGSVVSHGSGSSSGMGYALSAQGVGAIFSRFHVDSQTGNKTNASSHMKYDDLTFANGKFKMNRSMNVRR